MDRACIVSKYINFMCKFYLNPSGPYDKVRMYARIVSRDVELNSTVLELNSTELGLNSTFPTRTELV